MGEVKREKGGGGAGVEGHLPHWYARYNQIYRKRVEYMNVARQLQHRLRVPAGDNLDCLRTKAALGQNRRSPVVWNQKACTCHKCQTTALATYYPGILYLNSHTDRGHIYPACGSGERRCRSEGCGANFHTVIVGNTPNCPLQSVRHHPHQLAPIFAPHHLNVCDTSGSGSEDRSSVGAVFDNFPAVTALPPVVMRPAVSIPSKHNTRAHHLPPLPNITNLKLAPQNHIFY